MLYYGVHAHDVCGCRFHGTLVEVRGQRSEVGPLRGALYVAPGTELRLPDLCAKCLYPLGHPTSPGMLFNIK